MKHKRGRQFDRSIRFVALAVATVAMLIFHQQCLAQPSATAAALYEGSHKEGLGRWVDAIEVYQRILETGGDDLAPADRPIAPLANLTGGAAWAVPWPSYHFRPARSICRERFSRFPAEALKLYRDRIDGAAAKRLAEARQQPDDRLLEQLLGDWFCSRSGEDAISLLAERSFERGDFDTAERWWRMLLPRDPATFDELHYPDPKTPLAAVRARLLMVMLFRGERDEARRELKQFRIAHPNDAGLLAGREGKYADTLEVLLADPKRVALPENDGDAKTWATFAAHADRNSRIASGLPRYWPGPPTWRKAIPAEPNGNGRDAAPGPPDHPRALAFHPAIANGRAFVADATCVYSYDLVTGERETIFDLRKRMTIPNLATRLPAKIDTRYTLTFADGFLYVRLGAQSLRTIRADGERAAPSAIVCLGPFAARPKESPPLRWVLATSDAQSIFEGTPIVRGNRLYAIVWRFAGGDPVRLVACYGGLGRKEPPELVWEREIGRPPRPSANDPAMRHELLTLAGNNIVFGANSGSIIALDRHTGRPAWEQRYAISERRPPPVGRDLTPCLFDGFRVFAAPIDSDRLFCLDAFSGKLLWDREGVDVVHLLGVARGKLIATFAGPMKGIRGLDVLTGAETRPGGWTQHTDGGLASFGRGFVTPDLIFWPTRQGLYFLDPADGIPARQPVEGSFGNIAYADGCFIVTTAAEVIGFVSDGKLLEPRKREAEEKPAKILIYRQAIAEADAGLTEAALRHLDSLAKDSAEDAAIAAQASIHSGWLRLERAQRQHDFGDRQAAQMRWEEIVPRESTASALALVALARLSEDDRRTEDAIARWRMLRDTATRIGNPLLDIDGKPRPADQIAAESIARLRGERIERKTRGTGAKPMAPLPELALPLVHEWNFEFASPRWRPVPSISGDESSDGEMLWHVSRTAARLRNHLDGRGLQEFRCEHGITCASIWAGRLLVAGDNGVSCFNLADADRLWSWRLCGDLDPRALRPPRGVATGKLSGWHRRGGRLYAILNDSLLLAIDAHSGEVVWQHRAAAAGESAPPVAIRPRFFAGRNRLLLQLSCGQLRIIDAADGKTLSEFATPRAAWQTDPVALSEPLVAFPEDAETVSCLNLSTGKFVWRHPIERRASLTGSVASLRVLAGVLLVAVDRNLGVEVHALGPDTGRPLWREPQFLGARPFALRDADSDGRRIYLSTESGIVAVAPTSGERLWHASYPLSDADWRVICAQKNLILHPLEPLRVGNADREWRRWQAGRPTWPRLARFVEKSYDAYMKRTLPVVLLDSATGRDVQRLSFAALGPACAVRLRSDPALMIATGAGVWKLSADSK